MIELLHGMRGIASIVSGRVAGGMAVMAIMLLLFGRVGFSWNGQGIVLNPAYQSRKLTVIWTGLEPLPLIGLV